MQNYPFDSTIRGHCRRRQRYAQLPFDWSRMRMKLHLTSKKSTWIVIVLLLLLPLPSIVSYVQRFVVRNGVVTAYRYEVRAPIDGVVEGLSVTPGMVLGDKPALRIGNRRTRGRYNTLKKELFALEEGLAQSQALLDANIVKLINDLDQSLAILKARLKGEQAAKSETLHRRDRTNQLVEKLAATMEDADRVEAEFLKAEAQVRTTLLEIRQLGERRRMLSQGMFPHDMADSVLQIQNRINDLKERILDCRRRMSEADADIAQGSAPRDTAEMNSRAARATVKLPDTAVVWELDVQEGMEVAKGDRLFSYIDRSRLMIEVAVDDATLELIEQGQAARVRLFGSDHFIEGTVSQVMGSAGLWHNSLFAAEVRARGAREGRVLVSIRDDRLYDSVAKFCGVGRTAYAEFEGIGLLEQYFGAFLR
jgi:multidrug resistance efflux pump